MNEISNQREYDELESVLAARPNLKAPAHTRAGVLARLATLSAPEQRATNLTALSAKYPAPVVQPLVAPVGLEILEVSESRERRLLAWFVTGGAWLGLLLLGLWAVWPAIANFLFGPSTDPATQAHLALLQSVWSNLSTFALDFLLAYGPLLPTLISLAVGLALMTAILAGNNFSRRDFQAE